MELIQTIAANTNHYLIPFCFQTMSRKTRRGLLRVFKYVSTPSPMSDALIGRKRIGITTQQLNYFRERLLQLRQELKEKLEQDLCRIQEEAIHEPDPIDRASIETSHSLRVRACDQERQLIFKIDQALERIHDRTYGYCEETGEPIGLARLEAYPIATLCLEAQERSEQFTKNRRLKRS